MDLSDRTERDYVERVSPAAASPDATKKLASQFDDARFDFYEQAWARPLEIPQIKKSVGALYPR
jgi:hypothetical protein